MPSRTSASIAGLVAGAAALLALAASSPAPERSTDREATARQAAIGPLGGLSPEERRALDPAGFEPMGEPQGSDWLATHKESGQTFEEFRKLKRNVPRGKRTKLYLQPLGDLPKDASPPLEALRDYAAAFFDLPVEILEGIRVEPGDFSPRVGSFTGRTQRLTGDILDLLKSRLPEDAFAVLGITMEDLYPEPSWNYVFGQALLRGRVGIYSFARYDPAFFGLERGEEWKRHLLERSFKVLAHETGHMFALDHCIYFRCLMSGSNSLEEDDRFPLRLCPVCLRKLQASCGFSIPKRYERLARVLDAAGFEEEARWMEARRRWVVEGNPLPSGK